MATTFNSRYLVIGSGIAGLQYALLVAQSGTVNIVTKKESTESNTNYAQGGIAAVVSPLDSFDIHIADTIKLSETLRIEFFGTIGNNGCYDFSHDETNFEGNTISIKLWGKNSGSDDCPNVIVKLDGTYYDINFNATGSYVVEIIQPDNSKITNTVIVEDP